MDQVNDDCLLHYGVLGMKWGVRKVRKSTDLDYLNKKKKKFTKKVNKFQRKVNRSSRHFYTKLYPHLARRLARRSRNLYYRNITLDAINDRISELGQQKISDRIDLMNKKISELDKRTKE